MKDKLLHAGVCFLATFVGYYYMRIFCDHTPSFTASWLLPMGLGFGKEYGDNKASGNRWDWKDIIADAVGTALGMSVIFVIHLIKG